MVVELAGLAQTGPPQAGTRDLSPRRTALPAELDVGGAGGTRSDGPAQTGMLQAGTRDLSPEADGYLG